MNNTYTVTTTMTSAYLRQIGLLMRRLLLCYLLYFVSRVLFFVVNRQYFSETGFSEFASDCFFGLRFDSFSICVSNSLFILMSLMPFSFFYHRGYQTLLRWLFVLSNTVFLAFNFIDIAYFTFTRKRSTSDIFKQIGGQSDLGKLIPQFASDYWWTLLLFAFTIYVLVRLYQRIPVPAAVDFGKQRSALQMLLVSLLFSLSVGFTVLGIRGGFQRVPIDVVNAGAVTRPEGVSIVLNTPFSLIKSMEHNNIEVVNFYSEEVARQLFNPVHHFADSAFTKKNVVVIILESFAKEYTGLSRRQSLTPFLDSLMGASLVFENGFANGTKSIEGIPAILASMPSVMQNPFINSDYAGNRQTSFASLLRNEGYTTAFFHGGINGTMNFNDWAPAAGYAQYYGRNEYNNEADFDGYWGIFDEPFLQYTIKTMDGFKAPFHSAIFTLSSHHPYLVPEKYKNVFKAGPYENSASVRYADYSLRRFFESAQSSAWYKNTLFVLTPDHCSLSGDPFYSNEVGYFTIPVMFFDPAGKLKGRVTHTISQIDILPSVMQWLGYNKPFFSLGQSCFGQVPASAFQYINGKIYLYNDSMAYCFVNNQLKNVYNYRRDSILHFNLAGTNPVSDSLHYQRYKAFMQTYYNTLVKNTAFLK